MLLFFILIAIIIILAINVTLKLDMRDADISVVIVFLGVFKWRRRYTIRREDKEIYTLYRVKNDAMIKVRSLRGIISDATNKEKDYVKQRARRKTLNFVWRKARLRLDIKAVLGLYDAAATAMACGALSVVLTAIGARVHNKRRELRVQIRPHFSKQVFSIHAQGIMKLSLANIIHGVILHKKSLRR